ncbi:MAG: methylated-DNA--[protein]-cysteine S-methyltransferase [Acidobacteria bacterium]|nr:methylated-DNA--[protein]-cysteine S-methyltransferase [Acidobacteriota bacterium]
MATQMTSPEAEREWAAVLNRDRSLDGEFYYAVRTTGVYCRPSCPSRMPARRNVLFFRDRESAERGGFRPCLRCRPAEVTTSGADPDSASVRRICDFVEQNLDSQFSAAAVQAALGMRAAAINRVLRRALGVTLREYAEARRLALFKLNLGIGRSVADATYEAGYGSSRAAYEGVQRRLGMTPAVYRDGAPGQQIRFAVTGSPLGRMLVAATSKGLCRVAFGDSDARLEEELRGEFRRARIQRDAGSLQPFISALHGYLAGERRDLDLPLHIRASLFQRRVYRELRKIPHGQTRSYADIARALGQPAAHRAVARACAANSVAMVIPCHRVVRSNGALAGYRWGLSRKRKLLELEKPM